MIGHVRTFRPGTTIFGSGLQATSSGFGYPIGYYYTPGIMNSEKTLTYEMNYRFRFKKSLSSNIALFYNRYRDLLQPVNPSTTTCADGSALYNCSGSSYDLLLEDSFFATGRSLGGEIHFDWQISSKLRIRPQYSFIHSYFYKNNGTLWEWAGGAVPQHMAALNVWYNPFDKFSIDSFIYYRNTLQHSGLGTWNINYASYIDLDFRLGWKPISDLEISFVGNNVFSKKRYESYESNMLFGFANAVERKYALHAKYEY